jgi:hypothetical protein
MCGAIIPFPNTPSWRGAQLQKKHRSNFTFTSLNKTDVAYFKVLSHTLAVEAKKTTKTPFNIARL